MKEYFLQCGFVLIHETKIGGEVWRHKLVNIRQKDYGEILEISIDKAELGACVQILPILQDDNPLREIIFDDAKPNKCPDLKINNIYVEIKTPIEIIHERKISNCIKFASKQADYVIVRLSRKIDVQKLYSISKGRFLAHRHLQSIEFRINGEYLSFSRTEFI